MIVVNLPYVTFSEYWKKILMYLWTLVSLFEGRGGLASFVIGGQYLRDLLAA